MGLSVTKTSHRPSTRHGGIDLKTDAKNYVGEREPGTAKGLWRLLDGIAEITKQSDESFFFVRLCRVVSWPILGVSLPWLGECSRGTIMSDSHGGVTVSILIRERRCFRTVYS